LSGASFATSPKGGSTIVVPEEIEEFVREVGVIPLPEESHRVPTHINKRLEVRCQNGRTGGHGLDKDYPE
jgi:hypothetical protein